jgi:light-regulated signal transduction histidine kinase (bacteriophytochrome)
MSRGDTAIEQVDLSGATREIAEDLRQSQPDRRVEFVIPDGIHAQGDGRLLRVVLENLIRNAWKFTSKHSKARIEFGVQQQNETQVYFVRDDGAGFDMNYAQKLFGAFQRCIRKSPRNRRRAGAVHRLLSTRQQGEGRH